MRSKFINGVFSSNTLKIFAIVFMIIDHVGLYIGGIFDSNIAYILRFIGRFSMPIFAFLISEGIIHTRSINKYFMRVFALANVTQLLMYVLSIVNRKYFYNYYAPVNEYFNILYSFSLCIIAIKLINKTSEKYIKLLIVFCLLLIYKVVNIELGIRTPILVLGFYYIKKLKDNIKDVSNFELKIVYLVSLLLILFISVLFGSEDFIYDLPSLISIIFIALYNGKLGKKNKIIKRVFYSSYTLHHVILYFTCMIVLGR